MVFFCSFENISGDDFIIFSASMVADAIIGGTDAEKQ